MNLKTTERAKCVLKAKASENMAVDIALTRKPLVYGLWSLQPLPKYNYKKY